MVRHRPRSDGQADHFIRTLPENYGTLIKDARLECRAIFVVDPAGIVQHAEYVNEVASHPNYDAALEAAKSIGG